MLARVLLHVDLVDGNPNRSFERVLNWIRRAGQRQHTPVVTGVARPVEKVNARDAGDCKSQLLDDIETASFRKVGHRFDELRHYPIVPRSA